MKRLFKKGDRVSLGPNGYRPGVVIDQMTDDWLGEPFQILDIQIDGADGTSIRIPDTNVRLLEEVSE
jgi:hypothetical protein